VLELICEDCSQTSSKNSACTT